MIVCAKADEREKLARATALKLDPRLYRVTVEHRPDLDAAYPWHLVGRLKWKP